MRIGPPGRRKEGGIEAVHLAGSGSLPAERQRDNQRGGLVEGQILQALDPELLLGVGKLVALGQQLQLACADWARGAGCRRAWRPTRASFRASSTDGGADALGAWGAGRRDRASL